MGAATLEAGLGQFNWPRQQTNSSNKRNRSSGPALAIRILDAKFHKSGRYFLSLASGSASDQRTDVSESSRQPHFNETSFLLPLANEHPTASDLALLELSLTATQLQFSRGAKVIGHSSVGLQAATINGETREVEVQLLKPGAGRSSDSKAATAATAAVAAKHVVGVVRISWAVVDEDAKLPVSAATERSQTRERHEEQMQQQHPEDERELLARAGKLLAAAQHDAETRARERALAEAQAAEEAEEAAAAAAATARAALLRPAAIAEERAAAQRAEHLAAQLTPLDRATRAEAERAFEARVMTAQADEEERRQRQLEAAESWARSVQEAEEAALLQAAATRGDERSGEEAMAIRRAMADAASGAAAAVARATAQAASADRAFAEVTRAEETQAAWDAKWETLLRSRVALTRADGSVYLALTGRQAVGLSDALATRKGASRRSAGSVAVVSGGRKVLVPCAVAMALRARLEARMRELVAADQADVPRMTTTAEDATSHHPSAAEISVPLSSGGATLHTPPTVRAATADGFAAGGSHVVSAIDLAPRVGRGLLATPATIP